MAQEYGLEGSGEKATQELRNAPTEGEDAPANRYDCMSWCIRNNWFDSSIDNCQADCEARFPRS